MNKKTVKKIFNYTLWVLSFLLFFLLGNSVKAALIYEQVNSDFEFQSTGTFEEIQFSNLIGSFPDLEDYINEQIYLEFYAQTDCTSATSCLNTGSTTFIYIQSPDTTCWAYYLSEEDKELLVSDNEYHLFQVLTNGTLGNDPSCFEDELSVNFYLMGNSFFPTHGHTLGQETPDLPYLKIYTDSIPPIPGDTRTRAWITEPISTTTPTTFTLNYYLNSETHGNIIPSGFNLRIVSSNNATFPIYTQINLPQNTVIYDEIFSTTTTLNLRNNTAYFATLDLNRQNIPDYCNDPNLAIAICGWLQSTQLKIISSPTYKFIIGELPDTVIEHVAQIFDPDYQDPGFLQGQCAFIATSSCDITSFSTWQGCMINVGLALFCPSSATINYATSTLINSFDTKIPFGYFMQGIDKITGITTGTTTLGENIIVNISALGNASTTIFSWTEAKNFMDNVITENTVNILIYAEWILFSLYAVIRVKEMHD